MIYVPVPLNRLQIGKPLPVDIWTPDGRLLLRRGQILQSLSHRDMLGAHHACTTEADSRAWLRSMERSMRSMRAAGMDMAVISRAPMPHEILDTDYLEGSGVDGGWLDLQEVLRSLLYQGAEATNPLPRLQGLEEKAMALLRHDPDEALFVLFQALPDLNLGYCATQALLAGVVCALAADKMAHSEESPSLLLRSAMVMNIGMARPQDSLTRQYQPPDPNQRQIIVAHPPTSTEILRGFGISDEEVLGVVNWHHAPEQAPLVAEDLTRLRLLNLADGLIAKMAPRVSRPAMVPLGATKMLLLENNPGTTDLRHAIAATLGFYPPGSFVQLANGEIAVVIKRGSRANTPHVASIMNVKGIPLSAYVYHDTAFPRHAGFVVRAPVPGKSVNVRISLEKVRRLRQQHGV
jgi:hypothetical protein